MSTLDVFDLFTSDYARERFETMSLRDWLLLHHPPHRRRLAGHQLAIGPHPVGVRFNPHVRRGVDVGRMVKPRRPVYMRP